MEALQGAFVDDPEGVLIEADRLVRDLPARHGDPAADFDARAGQRSPDHPVVMNNYRAAQRIVSPNRRGAAGSEDRRKAVVHFQALFDELPGAGETPGRDTPSTRP